MSETFAGFLQTEMLRAKLSGEAGCAEIWVDEKFDEGKVGVIWQEFGWDADCGICNRFKFIQISTKVRSMQKIAGLQIPSDVFN